MTLHRIERLGHLGDGVAPGPVYATRTLPGELVEGEVEGGRILAPRIREPSPDRVAPPCPHYRRCGGCALQHASDRFVTGWKAEVVRRALSARGLSPRVDGVAVSPPQSRRRATLAARRLRRGLLLGFHAQGSATLVAIPECRLLHPDLMAGLPALEALATLFASRRAALAITVTASRTGLDVVVTGGRAADGDLASEAARLAAEHGVARLTADGELVAQHASPVQVFGRARVVPPAGGFLQATAEGEAALLSEVRRALAGAAKVADLFAGSGTFALPLAEAAEVHAVEGDPEAAAALQAGWRGAPGLRRVTAETRDLFRTPLLPADLAGFDGAVLDPPRAGAEAQARALAEGGPPVVVAVSCNPVTFARDARILADGGYAIRRLVVVDQFRWSPHVELVAVLRRETATG